MVLVTLSSIITDRPPGNRTVWDVESSAKANIQNEHNYLRVLYFQDFLVKGMTELRKSNSGLRFLRHELSVLLFQHITR
jgi:hypothetical protein